MRITLPILAFLSAIAATRALGAGDAIIVKVTSPAERAGVSALQEVSGTATDPKAHIWIVIHPMATSDYWVQTPVGVHDDGTWRALVHFGEPGQHHGADYEFRAIANPKVELHEGLVLHDWPATAAESDLVDVTRE